MHKLLYAFSIAAVAALLLAACVRATGGSATEADERLAVRDDPSPEAIEAEEELGASSDESSRAEEHTEAPPEESPEEPEAAPPAPREDWTVAVVSDLNGSYGSTDYHDEVDAAVDWLTDEVEPDAVISTGDMVAGQKPGLDYEAMWESFHQAVTEPLFEADIPLAVTPGNHDGAVGSVYLEERKTFVEQWQKHRPEVDFVDDRFYPLYFAFEIGPALFISLDATTTGPIDDEQRAWLEDLLEEREDAELKIVFGHVPLYPFSEERKDEILDDRDLEALFREHNVDMMLSGHHHAYYPGQRDDLRMVSMSCLGSGSRRLIGTEEASSKSVAVLRYTADGDLEVDAYDAVDHTPIERETLPEYLNGGRDRIWRDDVEPVGGGVSPRELQSAVRY